MEIRPVPLVGSVRRPYEKGPQQSGGHDDVRRFFMEARGAAAAASQVRPLDLLAVILAAPRLTSWYTHEKLLKTGVTAGSLRSFSIWSAHRSDQGNRSYLHFVVGQRFCWGPWWTCTYNFLVKIVGGKGMHSGVGKNFRHRYATRFLLRVDDVQYPGVCIT